MLSLRHAFPPEFAAFGETILHSHPDSIALLEVLRPAALDGVIASFATSFPGGERRAVLSLWSQYYLLALVPAVVATVLVTPDDVPVALETTRLVLAADGRPASFCPAPGGPAASTCPAARLTALLRTHLEPLARRLHEAGLPEAVLWSNAGHVLAWAVQTVLVPDDRRALIAKSLPCRLWVDGGPNPAAKACHAALCDNRRSACCLRFRVPGLSRCPGCPRAGG